MQLSDTGKKFIAGILHHANEISAVTNQWVNSYKRLIHGGEAPTAASWGRANRSALVRLPLYTPTRCPHAASRSAASTPRATPTSRSRSCWPPGSKGITEDYELPDEAEDDVWALTPPNAGPGYKELPGSLAEALVAMEESELVAETLGEHVFDYFLRNKWTEWTNYRSHVTPFELRNYLPL